MECREVQRAIWSGVASSPDVSAHTEHCLTCRVEARRAEQLGNALAALRTEYAVPPAGLEQDLLALVGRSPIRRVREVVVSHPRIWQGAAAAAAAAAFGLIVARRLGRAELAA